MEITVNGERREVPDSWRVGDLLRDTGLSESPCAVEVNAEVLRTAQRDEHLLQEGDAVEIVTLVGGG